MGPKSHSYITAQYLLEYPRMFVWWQHWHFYFTSRKKRCSTILRLHQSWCFAPFYTLLTNLSWQGNRDVAFDDNGLLCSRRFYLEKLPFTNIRCCVSSFRNYVFIALGATNNVTINRWHDFCLLVGLLDDFVYNLNLQQLKAVVWLQQPQYTIDTECTRAYRITWLHLKVKSTFYFQIRTVGS